MPKPMTAAKRRERKIALARQAGELDRELRKLPAGVLASLVQRRTGRWPTPLLRWFEYQCGVERDDDGEIVEVEDPESYASVWPATVLIGRIKSLDAESRKLGN